MAKDPAFQWYASDWLGSNRRAMMTLEQQAAYMNLLCRQWTDKTCSLPDDDEALAQLSELGEGWFKGGGTTLRDCFPKHPTLEGRIANTKLLELRTERNAFLEKSAEGGRKSAAAKRKRRGKGGSTTVGTKRQANGNSPSPSPSPTIKEEVPNGTSMSSSAISDQVKAVIAHYQTHHPKARPGKKERALLQARLKEGYGVADLCRAIDGCHRSPHHCGQNETGAKYQSLELIVRDSKHVQQFMEVPDKPPEGPNNGRIYE